MTTQTLNYTPVAVGIIGVFALGSWFVSARKWFTGPIRQVEAELRRVSVNIIDEPEPEPEPEPEALEDPDRKDVLVVS